MHSTGIIDPKTGRAIKASAPGWTSVFSDALIDVASEHRNIVAITAAMPGPTGLSKFGERFPIGCSTSVLPSSMPSPPRPGSPWAVCIPWSRSTPRS